MLSTLREHGLEQLTEVKRAWMEADGEISVIKASGERGDGVPRKVGRTPGAG